MHYKYGYNFREIGDINNYTESNASLKHKNIIKFLKNSFNLY